MERRRSKRDQILVDIDIAHPGAGACHGRVENISNSGVSIVISRGDLPAEQRSVILNLRVWTGNEMLYRRMYCRVVRREEGRMAMEFAENDLVAEAIVQDMMFYQRRARQREVPERLPEDIMMAVVPETAGSS